MRLLSSIRDTFLDYLFPRTAEERALLASSPGELLLRLPAAAHIGNDAFALFEYAHPGVKDLVWLLKYKGDREAAAKLGVLLFDTLSAELEEGNLREKYGTPLLVAMPASGERRLTRGYNQAELLCAAVASSDRGTLAYLPHALTKVRHTESQTETRGRAERLENLRGSMAASSEVSGRLVVVIDDVITTGATWAEAKRALGEAGARKAMIIAVAH
ncbi:hypothetical protein KW784_01705 [Candidatus Parcubacteria bacterium]|nr:hypothetical protein [Candidatus Parcubacteria bacterium]